MYCVVSFDFLDIKKRESKYLLFRSILENTNSDYINDINSSKILYQIYMSTQSTGDTYYSINIYENLE